MRPQPARDPRSLRLAPAAALGLLAILSLGMTCAPSSNLIVESPPNGTFTTAGSITVSGRITNPKSPSLTVDGVSVPVNPDGTWSTSVTLDPVAIVNPIVVSAVSGGHYRERITVFAADSVLDGDFSLEAMAMRITDVGLDAMEPVMASLFVLDPATLVPVGSVLDSGCKIVDPLFGACLGSSTTTVASPAPSISGFALDIVPITDAMTGTVSIFDLEINIHINGSGLVPTCGVRLTANQTDLPGTYEVEPDPVDPSNVDVNQTSIGVSFSGFNQTFTSGICDVLIIGDIIQLIIGDLQDDVTQGFQAFLTDPDGAGPADGPIADAIETATSGLDLDGTIGTQIGVNLEAPHFALDEDPNGLTIGTDARITASMPVGSAPDLAASYHIDEVFPVFGTTTPVSGLPYGLGLCIGTSAFNQLLKAEVESGLLAGAITELDLGAGPTTLTAGLLSVFVPELAAFDPAELIELVLEPGAAPFVTGAPGPAGELALMHVPHLVIKMKPVSTNVPLVEVVVDAQVGLDFAFVAGELAVTIGSVAPGSIHIDIIDNRINTNETVLASVLGFTLDTALPSLADSFGSFPIPSLLGLTTTPVEVSRAGEFISLFLDVN